MNVESYRKLRAQSFLNAIRMQLDKEWFEFLNNWEINATEQLKLLQDEDWEEFFDTFTLKKKIKNKSHLITHSFSEYDLFLQLFFFLQQLDVRATEGKKSSSANLVQ